MLVVKLDPERWHRGMGVTDSYLLRREDHKMCCMGFACIGVGVKLPDLLQVPAVRKLMHLDKIPDWWCETSGPIMSLYAINDNPNYESDEARVKDLNVISEPLGLRFELEAS